jgi:hypothetical protein
MFKANFAFAILIRYGSSEDKYLCALKILESFAFANKNGLLDAKC